MFDLNVLARDRLVFTPAQYLSNSLGTGGQLRKYSQIGTRVYYSTRTDASALFGSPLVRGIALSDVGGRVHVEVTLFTLGTSTTQAAMFTYTGTTSPLSTKWKTVDLVGETPVAVIGSGVTVGHLQRWHTVSGAGGTDIDPKDGVGSSSATVNDVFGVVQAVSDTGDVVADTNQMRLYSIPLEAATEAQPKIPTTLFVTTPSPLSLPVATTYGATIKVDAVLSSPSVGGLDGKRVIFRLGRSSISGITGAGGAVEAFVPVNVLPRPESYQLRVSFGEDDTALGSSAQFGVNVSKARPAFEPSTGTATVQYSDNVRLGTLKTSTGQLLRWQPIILTRAGLSPVEVASYTDGNGDARLDTMDFGGLAAGPYTIVARYPGDGVRYEAATSGEFAIAVEKERATIEGPSPQQTGAVTFRSTVVQEGPPADRAPGDLTRAGISYALTDEAGTTLQSGTATVAVDGTWSFTRTVAPGVYTITATITGDYFTGGGTTIAVVYDPTTFGTGGGTIVLGDTALPAAGRGKKANFGFNVKYKENGIDPTGSLNVTLKEAGLDLKAVTFDWLIISGGRAEFEGAATSGTLTGLRFRVIAFDRSPDSFEIRVWDASGSFDAPTYRIANNLGGGSVQIH
jgi:hypothetical protein